MSESVKKPKLPTPWAEFQRYGVRRAILSWPTGVSVAVGLIATFTVPWGGRELLQFLGGLHGAMLGFGLSVFGFTILGGKDDFFEPVMQSRGRTGLTALRDMVLLLWWPLIFHALALGLCGIRMVRQPFWEHSHIAALVWRGGYASVAVYSVVQSYLSMRFLFTLAITRLKWRFQETQQGRGGTPASTTTQPTSTDAGHQGIGQTPTEVCGGRMPASFDAEHERS